MAHIQMSFYSNALKKNANVMIFLPTQDADDYLFGSGNAKYDPNKKYQTLYLLHGSYGDCTDWGRLSSVERYAQQHCLAVVMPSAENSSYLNMDYGEAYLDYIGRELPAFLRIMFPLSEKREDTFIAGLSMGGYGAWRVGLEYPEQYGAIASLSGGMQMRKIHSGHSAHMDKMDKNYQAAVNGPRNTADPRNDLLELLKQDLAQGRQLPRLYMTCGTEDFIFPYNESFYEEASGLAPITYVKHPGVHDCVFWDTYLREVMDWLPLAGEKV